MKIQKKKKKKKRKRKKRKKRKKKNKREKIKKRLRKKEEKEKEKEQKKKDKEKAKNKEEDDEEDDDDSIDDHKWYDSLKFWGKHKDEAEPEDKKKNNTAPLKDVLPKVEFPRSIGDLKDGFKDLKDINLDDTNILECVQNLKPALPQLMKYGRHVTKGRTHRATRALSGVLEYLPAISKNCFGQEFKPSPNKEDNQKCEKGLAELTALVSELAKHPVKTISDKKTFKKTFDLIPDVLQYCGVAIEKEL